MRVIYEGGLEVSPGDEETVAQRHHLRRLAVKQIAENGEERLLILSAKGEVLEAQAPIFHFVQFSKPSMLHLAFALAYDVNATIYHCKQVAGAYVAVCKRHTRIRAILGHPSSEAGIAQFADQASPYYELDALLSAARRAYDKTGNMLWAAFGNGVGGRPRNFADTLNRCPEIPGPLAKQLELSWADKGSKLKDYRDCTQHFTSTDIGMCMVMVKRLEGVVWRATARIPDNPEVKSKNKFTYTLGLDALTYGWEIAKEVVTLSSEVVSSIAGSKAGNERP
jgi:hypothetical protein